MRTIGLVPPDAGDAAAPPTPATKTVAATLTDDTANNTARRTRRARVAFMLPPLLGPVRWNRHWSCAQSRDSRDLSSQ
jgi:hypothetical protein